MKICIICVYFGELPNYFDLFIKSCEWNQTIDFLMVTDQELRNLPLNIKLLQTNLTQLKRRIEKKLGFDVCLETAYKLCDYKPTYGYIFEEYLTGYDYWGHSDCDLIWGDIRAFIEKNNIEKYDRFLAMGHLSLYRNNNECNKFFMLSGSDVGDYKTVFSSNDSYLFDEAIGMNRIMEINNISFFTQVVYADIDVIYHQYKIQEIGKFPYNKPTGYNQYCLPRGSNYKKQVFYWLKGKCFRAYEKNGVVEHEEYMYIHLQKRKFLQHMVPQSAVSFWIIPSGFLARDENKDIELSDFKLNHYRGIIVEEFEYVRWLMNRWINAIRFRIGKKGLYKSLIKRK